MAIEQSRVPVSQVVEGEGRDHWTSHEVTKRSKQNTLLSPDEVKCQVSRVAASLLAHQSYRPGYAPV